MNNQFENREVLSVRQIAGYLGVSESIVRRLIKKQQIPYVRIEGQYKFFLPTVREWLMGNTIAPTAMAVSDEPHARTLSDSIWNKAMGG